MGIEKNLYGRSTLILLCIFLYKPTVKLETENKEKKWDVTLAKSSIYRAIYFLEIAAYCVVCNVSLISLSIMEHNCKLHLAVIIVILARTLLPFTLYCHV